MAYPLEPIERGSLLLSLTYLWESWPNPGRLEDLLPVMVLVIKSRNVTLSIMVRVDDGSFGVKSSPAIDHWTVRDALRDCVCLCASSIP